MNHMTGLSENHRLRTLLFGSLWPLVSAACLWPVQAHSDNEGVGSRLEKLFKVGFLSEAEKEIRPAQVFDGPSATLKFSACVLQAQQSAPKKAIACFQQFVQEYPELPEAYNNIGVLYAGIGMQIEARKWFERGLKQQQAYATLHQNLLNLQSEINRNAYAVALQLDISKSNISPKLSLLGKITSVPEITLPASSSVSASLPRKMASASIALVEPVAVKEKVAEKSMINPAVSASVPTVPSAALSAVDLTQQSQVRETVHTWAQAWSQKDLNAYFKSYSPNFNPGANLSRSAWEEQRRVRIMSKKQIHVELSEINISFSNAKTNATATFLQSYQSGAILTVSRKTLELSEDKGQWLITREFVSGAGS